MLLEEPQTTLCLAKILFLLSGHTKRRIYARQQPVLRQNLGRTRDNERKKLNLGVETPEENHP